MFRQKSSSRSSNTDAKESAPAPQPAASTANSSPASPASSPAQAARFSPTPAGRGEAQRIGAPAEKETQSRLIVGPDIKLKGEISSCERLRIEGQVDATVDSRHLEIAQSGRLTGQADVESADISGHFDGRLHVGKRLIVRAGGVLSGEIDYGELEIEAGGIVTGNIACNSGKEGKPATKTAQSATGAEAVKVQKIGASA